MSTKKYYGEERETRARTSLFMLRIFVRKLKKSLSYLAAAGEKCRNKYYTDFVDEDKVFEMRKKFVPHDVKEGHLALVARKGSEKKRFVVKIEWLNRPEFLRLLKMAEEEYGFEQSGVLVIPCTPQELEKALKLFN